MSLVGFDGTLIISPGRSGFGLTARPERLVLRPGGMFILKRCRTLSCESHGGEIIVFRKGYIELGRHTESGVVPQVHCIAAELKAATTQWNVG